MGLNFIKESITLGADKITDKTFTFFKQGFRIKGAIGEPEYRDVTVSGLDVLNLPNAKADGLNYCKLYGKCEFTAGADVIPTPTQPLDIICNNGVVKVSPNLFDKNGQYIAGFVNSDNGVLTGPSGTTGQRSFVVPCLPNTTYVLQGMTASSAWGSFTSTTIGTRATSYVIRNTTLTTGNNDKYLIGLAYTLSGIDYRNTLQIETGSTPTTYMPYKQVYTDGTTETVKDSLNNTATAENLLSVGTYKDFQEVLTGALTKNIDTIVLAGDESGLGYYGVYSGHNLFYYEISATQAFKAEINAPLCTHYTPYSGDATEMPNNCARYQIGNSMTNYNRIYFTDDRFSTLSDWKAFIAQQYTKGTPIIIATIRPTPTTSTVTAQTLTTKKGTNTIEITQASLTDLPIEVNYMAGVSVTVQQIGNSNLDNQVTVTIGE